MKLSFTKVFHPVIFNEWQSVYPLANGVALKVVIYEYKGNYFTVELHLTKNDQSIRVFESTSTMTYFDEAECCANDAVKDFLFQAKETADELLPKTEPVIEEKKEGKEDRCFFSICQHCTKKNGTFVCNHHNVTKLTDKDLSQPCNLIKKEN